MTISTSPQKRFGLWARLLLTQKLLLAFGVSLLFSLIITGVTLYGLNGVEREYEEAISEGVELRRLASLMEIDLLQARRAEKNFLLRWEEEGFDTAYNNYVTNFNENVVKMRSHIRDLEPFGPSAATLLSGEYTQQQYEADIVTLRRYLFIYEQTFIGLVETYERRGDENTGLEGELTLVARTLEETLPKGSEFAQLRSTLFEMRRSEKNYLLHSDPTYVDEVNSISAQFKQQIDTNESLTDAQKEQLRTLTDTYIEKFDALVDLDEQIMFTTAEMIAAARTMEPVTVKIVDLGQQLGLEDTQQAHALSTQIQTATAIIVAIVLLLSVLLAFTIARQLTSPLLALTNTAKEIASGKIDEQAEVTSSDEIGTLAESFNSMTLQLRQTLDNVNKRAAQLATVAQVSTNTATVLDPFQMVATAVHLTQRGFNLYHAHVFEYNKTTDELQIVACGYKEGDEHEGTHGTAHIPLQREQSLVARAARTRKPVIVNDVRSDPGWLPNPLLPETRAELAVPMVVGDELIGVLDVQSEYVDAFNEEDSTIQMTLAAQLAVAMKNAQSYSTARDQAKMETLVNAIGQKIQRAGTVEDTLQIAIRELGLALGASRVKARIENPDKAAAQETAS
jgi:HAMP domain-containing protein